MAMGTAILCLTLAVCIFDLTVIKAGVWHKGSLHHEPALLKVFQIFIGKEQNNMAAP